MIVREDHGAAHSYEVARHGARPATPLRTPHAPRPAPESPLWEAWAPRNPHARHGRRVLALGLAALALLPAALVALPIALALACEHGPARALFRQERVGWRGRTFRMWKFRTLRTDVDGAAATHASRLGRFLRRTHLDELPQLVNVLRGEMDLVGPRPETLAIDAWARASVPDFHRRNALRPGLTGLAQITQGYAAPEVTAYEEKLRLDRRYLAQATLATDVAILARTLAWVLCARGAQVRSRHVLRPVARRR